MRIDTQRIDFEQDAVKWEPNPPGDGPANLSDDNSATFIENDDPTPDITNTYSVQSTNAVPVSQERVHRCRYRVEAYAQLTVQTPQTVGCRWQAETIDPVNGNFQGQATVTITALMSDTPTVYEAGWTLESNPNASPRLLSLRANHTNGDAQSSPIAWSEAWFDVDMRNRPVLNPYVTDQFDGPSVTTVTLTNRPWVNYTFDLDGLPWNQYTVTLEDLTTGGGFKQEVGFGVQPPPGTASAGAGIRLPVLTNGHDYRIEMQIASSIGQGVPYFAFAQTVDITMDLQLPNPPLVSTLIGSDPPSVEITATRDDSPGAAEWDDPDGIVAEFERIDECQGGEPTYIHSELINATSDNVVFVDRFMSLSDTTLPDCDGEDGICDITYRVRWWGTVNTVLFASDWGEAGPLIVENPTPGNGWLRAPQLGEAGAELDISVCAEREWARERPYGVTQPAQGGLPVVVTGDPGGRDHALEITFEHTADVLQVEQLLAQTIVFYQPPDPRLPAAWLAPADWQVAAESGTFIRRVSVDFTEVLPEPLAPLSDLVPLASV